MMYGFQCTKALDIYNIYYLHIEDLFEQTPKIISKKKLI